MASGAGNYAVGDVVTIHAGTYKGYKFSGWTSNDGVTFANPESAITTFIMPDNPVIVTAHWKGTDNGCSCGCDSIYASLASVPLQVYRL